MKKVAALSLRLKLDEEEEEEEVMTRPSQRYDRLYASLVSHVLVDHSLQNCQQQAVSRNKKTRVMRDSNS